MDAGKWYQVGNPFVELDNGTTPTLNSVFATGFSNGDQIYIYDSSASTYSRSAQWMTFDTDGGWRDGWGEKVDPALKPGQAVFIYKKALGQITLKGKVSIQEVEFGSDQATWSQVACLYPETQKLNEMEWKGMENGDQIYLYDSNSSKYSSALQWMTVNGVSGWRDGWGELKDVDVAPGQAMFIYKRSGRGTCKAKIVTK